jgi:hypothetical protein
MVLNTCDVRVVLNLLVTVKKPVQLLYARVKFLMDLSKRVSSRCGRAKFLVYGTMARRVTQCKFYGFFEACFQHMRKSQIPCLSMELLAAIHVRYTVNLQCAATQL